MDAINELHPTAVIGTNSWGSAAYETLLRGSSVDEDTLRAAMRAAKECGLNIYDLAQDYGFGKAQKMIGEFGTQDICLSAKYTPLSAHRPGCVRKSLEKDLQDFHREYVDIYWLHLPVDIEQDLKEIIELAKEGKIRHMGFPISIWQNADRRRRSWPMPGYRCMECRIITAYLRAIGSGTVCWRGAKVLGADMFRAFVRKK